MIAFGVCKNCGRPIFWDWRGAHHVKQDHNFDLSADYSKPECDKAEEAWEED